MLGASIGAFKPRNQHRLYHKSCHIIECAVEEQLDDIQRRLVDYRRDSATLPGTSLRSGAGLRAALYELRRQSSLANVRSYLAKKESKRLSLAPE